MARASPARRRARRRKDRARLRPRRGAETLRGRAIARAPSSTAGARRRARARPRASTARSSRRPDRLRSASASVSAPSRRRRRARSAAEARSNVDCLARFDRVAGDRLDFGRASSARRRECAPPRRGRRFRRSPRKASPARASCGSTTAARPLAIRNSPGLPRALAMRSGKARASQCADVGSSPLARSEDAISRRKGLRAAPPIAAPAGAHPRRAASGRGGRRSSRRVRSTASPPRPRSVSTAATSAASSAAPPAPRRSPCAPAAAAAPARDRACPRR